MSVRPQVLDGNPNKPKPTREYGHDEVECEVTAPVVVAHDVLLSRENEKPC